MTTIPTIAAVALTFLGACTIENSGAHAADERTPPPCAACHQDDRSFVGRDADELAERIKAIRDGTLQHPPLGLADSSDAAIEKLANELSSE